MIGIAALLSAPIGIGCGIYLANFGRGPAAVAVRYLSDVLANCRLIGEDIAHSYFYYGVGE